MSKYRKLIVALVGVAAIVLGPSMLDVVPDEQMFTQAVIGLLTAAGIWGVPNETA